MKASQNSLAGHVNTVNGQGIFAKKKTQGINIEYYK